MVTTNSQKKSPRNSTKNERTSHAPTAPETPRPKPSVGPDDERYLDHSSDLVARVRAAREAAQREMEAFGDVSEYDTCKIYGQRTDITYEDADDPAEQPASGSQGHNSPPKEKPNHQPAGNERPQAAFDFTSAEADPSRHEEE